jgi:hypothetical protein
MRRDPILAALLTAFTFTCAALGARTLIDVASVDLALALQQQDVRLHQPSPPGSVLYVWLAQFLNAWVHDEILALRAVAAAMLVAAAYCVYRLAELVADRATARTATFLFVTSPLVLFHGMTTATYGAEAFGGAFVLLLCLRAQRRAQVASSRSGAHRTDLKLEAYLVGLAAGLRQTMLLFTVPVLLLTARRMRLSRRDAGMAGLAWLLGTLCWLLPQIERAHGPGDYFAANVAMLKYVFSTSPLRTGLSGFGVHLHGMATALLCGLGALRVVTGLGLAAMQRPNGSPSWADRPADTAGARGVRLDAPLLAAGLLLPALAALAWHLPASGAILAAWPAACIGLATLILGMVETATRSRAARIRRAGFAILLGAAWVVDLAAFFALPTPREANAARASEAHHPDPPETTSASGRGTAGAMPAVVGRLAGTVFAGVDFFYDRTRRAEFADLLEALRGTGFPPQEVLVLGEKSCRAAAYFMPEITIIQADPVRPRHFLEYRNRRARLLPEAYVVPDDVTWILIEGSPAQLQDSSSEGSPEPGEWPDLRLAGHLSPVRIGRQGLDAWFVPSAPGAPIRLHLFRAAPRPTESERAAAGADSAFAWDPRLYGSIRTTAHFSAPTRSRS